MHQSPSPLHQWKQFHTKQEMIAALGKRLLTEFPTTRFNFTQPIIDSVTEDTNGTSTTACHCHRLGASSAAILTLFVVPVLYDVISPKIRLTLPRPVGSDEP